MEQPNGMFTNTDITSHIWFFDNQHKSSKVQVIKAQNDEQPLFVAHPQGKDKMKNAYSDENIEQLLAYFSNEAPYIAKQVDAKGLHELNVSQLVGRKEQTFSISLDEMFAQVEESLQSLCACKGVFK